MAQYNLLVLVRREEMVDLFKQGTIYPNNPIKVVGSLDALAKKPKDVLKVFAKVPAIEYSIHYFLLFVNTTSSSLSKGLKIDEVKAIIPLDEESERMGLQLMPPIRLEKPIFADVYRLYQAQSAEAIAAKGVANMEAIFGIEDLWKSIKKLTRKQLPGLVAMITDDDGKLHPKTIWEHLLCYNRMQTYPNGTRGAFLDTMSVLQNFRSGKVDIKDQTTTSTGCAILNAANPKYATLIEVYAQSEKFIQAADKAYKDFWKIAPLYFILLDFFSHASEDGTMVNGIPVSEFVVSVRNYYDESLLKPALLMLGITLGQGSTYKLLYASKRGDFSVLQ